MMNLNDSMDATLSNMDQFLPGASVTDLTTDFFLGTQTATAAPGAVSCASPNAVLQRNNNNYATSASPQYVAPSNVNNSTTASSPYHYSVTSPLPPFNVFRSPSADRHHDNDSCLSSSSSDGGDAMDDARIYTTLEPIRSKDPFAGVGPASPIDYTNDDVKHKFKSAPLNLEASTAMDSWTYKHPEEWGSDEIIDWIYTYFPRIKNPDESAECRGENFASLTGRQMMTMTCDDFVKLDPNYGNAFYKMFQLLLESSQFTQPDLLTSCSSEEVRNLIDGHTHKGLDIDACLYDYDINGFKTEDPLDLGYESTSSSDLSHPRVPTTVLEVDNQDMNASGFLDTTQPHQLPGNRYDTPMMQQLKAKGTDQPLQQQQQQQQARNRARSGSNGSLDGSGGLAPPPKKRGRRAGQLSKGNHLWEFIRDLLLDPATNPSLIRWEDEENGVFRIVNSKRVSELWGQKKSNPAMNYEKLSRAMRHYYKSEILEVVLGRRLVYRFGKNSSGWQKQSSQAAVTR